MALHKFLKKVQRKKNYQEHEGTSEELTAVKKKKKKVSEFTLNSHFQRQSSSSKHSTWIQNS